MFSGTSSSTRAFTITSAGTTALVPVMKKPTGKKTIPEMSAALTPPAPEAKSYRRGRGGPKPLARTKRDTKGISIVVSAYATDRWL